MPLNNRLLQQFNAALSEMKFPLIKKVLWRHNQRKMELNELYSQTLSGPTIISRLLVN